MKPPALAADEEGRLAALEAYEILDSEPEDTFDDLTRIGSYIAGTPIALVSLVDRNRQWFKARHGLDATETPRDISFCGHVVATAAPLVVEDASVHPWFEDNPLVVGDPKIRAYVGMPLRTPEGHDLGTFCVIDDHARTFSQEQLELLRGLARQTMALLTLRRERAFRTVAERRMREALVVRDHFLARLSTEMREPLNAIHGYAQLLEQSLAAVAPEQVSDLGEIRVAAERARDMFDRAHELATLEEGHQRPDPAEVELGPLLAGVLDSLRPGLHARGVEASVATCEAEVLRTDAALLRRALRRMLEVCGRSPGATRLDLGARRHDRWIHFDVEVDGEGIPATELGRPTDALSVLQGRALSPLRPRNTRPRSGPPPVLEAEGGDPDLRDGLSLAIVLAVCESLGGRVEYRPDHEGRARLRLSVLERWQLG